MKLTQFGERWGNPLTPVQGRSIAERLGGNHVSLWGVTVVRIALVQLVSSWAYVSVSMRWLGLRCCRLIAPRLVALCPSCRATEMLASSVGCSFVACLEVARYAVGLGI